MYLDTCKDLWFIHDAHGAVCMLHLFLAGILLYLLLSFHIQYKVSKGAKIRNRYNQVPHLTQDINGKVTNSQ